MVDLALAFDAVLALALVGLAIRVLTTPDLFRAIVLFIVFGLLMALSWARLDAPDIALAEAAIGAGLTGALLVEAASAVRGAAPPTAEDRRPLPRAAADGRRGGEQDRAVQRPGVAATIGAGLVLTAILTVTVLDLPDPTAVPRPPVAERIGESGVTQPVTAVLLNFRAYDTWLEVGVLILAVLAVLALHRVSGLQAGLEEQAPNPVLTGASWALIPFMVLAGGYLLWRGTHGPGGAFQAGAVLGAAGILLRLTGRRRLTGALLSGRPLRVLAVAGFAAFLLAAAGTLAGGRELLAFPVAWSSWAIVAIETAVTISIAWTLGFFYVGATPPTPATDRLD